MEVENYLLTKNDFELCTTGAFKNLLSETEFVDVTLACPDEKQFDAHKVVLSACSPFFKKILLKNKKKDQLIYLKGILSRDLMSILQFMYTGQTKVCKENLDGFLLAAQELQVEGLVYSEIGQSRGKDMKSKERVVKEMEKVSKLIEDEVNGRRSDEIKPPPPPPVIKKEPKTPRKTKSSSLPPKPDFKCEECQLYLQNQNHLDVHNEMLHKKITTPQEKLKTEPIDDPLNSKADMYSTEIDSTDASEGSKDYSCETDGCEFLTKNRNDLKAHILSLHLGLKKYSQPPIQKENSDSREVELKTSSPDSEGEILGPVAVEPPVEPPTKPKQDKSDTEKRFFCEVCDFGTVHKFNLKRHMTNVHQMLALDTSVTDSHTEDDILGAEASLEESKKKKRKVGVDLENVDPSQILSCDRCDFTTTHIKSKRRHMMVIHEGLRHPCDYCSFEATQPYDVKKHMMKKHPEKV